MIDPGDKLVVVRRSGGWPVDMFGKGVRLDVVAARGDRVTVMYPGLMQAREFLVGSAGKPGTFKLASESRPERVLTVERISVTPNAKRYGPDEHYVSMVPRAGGYRAGQLDRRSVAHILVSTPPGEDGCVETTRGTRALCGFDMTEHWDGCDWQPAERADCPRCVEKYEKIMGRTPTPNGTLTLGEPTQDTRATAALRSVKKLALKNHGDLNSAVVSAGGYAQKLGHTMYVYEGTSYGHHLWRVSDKPSEYLNRINNWGTRMLSVTPELLVSWHEVNRGEQTPNAAYYVWTLRTDGTPLESEGPYGPHDLEGAKTFARIAATEGAHDRAVSRGVDPTAISFEIVRRYKAGTGNRVI